MAVAEAHEGAFRPDRFRLY